MKLLRTIKSILLWSYERGTWQYDVLCILILAFIFLTPSSLFKSTEHEPATPARLEQRQDLKPSEKVNPQATEQTEKESQRRKGELPELDR